MHVSLPGVLANSAGTFSFFVLSRVLNKLCNVKGESYFFCCCGHEHRKINEIILEVKAILMRKSIAAILNYPKYPLIFVFS